MKKIFWTPQAAMQSLASLKFGMEKGTEVSTALVISPCDEYGILPIEVVEGKVERPALSTKYPHLSVLAAVIPQQEGSGVTSTYTHAALEEEFEKYVKPVYPFLTPSFLRGWLHNHPAGTSPSPADLATFQGYVDLNPAYHLMVIYEPNFINNGTIHTRLFVNNKIEIPNVTAIPANDKGITHVVYNNDTRWIDNPHTPPQIIVNKGSDDNIIHLGMQAGWWRMFYPEEYKVLDKEKSWKHTTLYTPTYGETHQILFGYDYYTQKVRLPSTSLAKSYKERIYPESKGKVTSFSDFLDTNNRI